MDILGELKMFGRFIWGLRGFLRHTITLEEARETIRRRMADREANFLRMVERGIFGYTHSPYLPLLKLAGCELGDIRNMVRAKGLEGTLHALREAGVYITFEEFKGREPVVRGGKVIPVKDRDFDNPYLSRCYHSQSGGTTGAGTRISTDIDHIADAAPTYMITFDAHGFLNAPTAIWRGILPDGSGIDFTLRTARMGHATQKWFSPFMTRDLRASIKYRMAKYSTVMMAKLFGASIPWPEPLNMDKAAVLAHWAAEALRVHGACLISASVSRALRVSVAAREEGLDLTGAVFMGGGEPPTPAKVKGITDTGARWVPNYHTTEIGHVGCGCGRPLDGNDLHLFKDRAALIQHDRRVPGSDIIVKTFYFTTLLASAPKLMLNVENDDYGVIEERSCGCPLEAFGFTEHLRHIRSFRKLTGEGVTLVGSEMVRILEEVLPDRFGGSALDYQLMEEEDEKGFTRLTLLVSPKVRIADEAAVIQAVLNALEHSSVAANLARVFWSQAGTLQIKRMEPIWTARGKMMPIYVVRQPERSSS